jgi:hypothetical protein
MPKRRYRSLARNASLVRGNLAAQKWIGVLQKWLGSCNAACVFENFVEIWLAGRSRVLPERR